MLERSGDKNELICDGLDEFSETTKYKKSQITWEE
jgi:hypothetical protein